MRPVPDTSRLTTPPTSISEITSPPSRRITAGGRPPLLIDRPVDLRPRPRRIAIRNPDGVHRGHAATVRGCDTVLTFDPHPLALLAPARTPRLLTSLRTRAELLGQPGVRELVIVPFDEHVARQGPDAFVGETLLAPLGAVHVSVGDSFRYAANGAGAVESLRARTASTTAIGELVSVAGGAISSTRIRAEVGAGDVVRAAAPLGRPPRLTARVAGIHRPGPGPAAMRLQFQPWQVCPAPGGYVRGLQAGPAGHRVVGAVRILSRSRDAGGSVEAHISWQPGPTWTNEVTVELLRPHPVRTVAPRTAHHQGE